MIRKIDKNAVRKKRHWRMRKNIVGTEARPRLNIYRSSKHIYAQVIDDSIGSTLVSASSLDAEIKGQLDGKTKKRNSKAGWRTRRQACYPKGYQAGRIRQRRLRLYGQSCRTCSRRP